MSTAFKPGSCFLRIQKRSKFWCHKLATNNLHQLKLQRNISCENGAEKNKVCFAFTGCMNQALIILKSYKAQVSTRQGTQGAEYIYIQSYRKIGYCSDEFWDQIMKHLIRVYMVLHVRGIQQPQPGTPGEPLLFSISALGSLTCVTNTRDQRIYVPSKGNSNG